MRLHRSRSLTVLVVVAVALVLVGGAWFVGTDFGAVEGASFGWFAYAPTTGTTFDGGIVALSRSGAAALALLGAGALLLAGAAGYAYGRRTPRAPASVGSHAD